MKTEERNRHTVWMEDAVWQRVQEHYNNVSCLHMPVQNDLSGSLPIFLTELGKQRLFTQRPVAVPERIPRLCGHAVFAQKGFQLRLLIVRVQLGLQYGGLHFAQGQYLLKVI